MKNIPVYRAKKIGIDEYVIGDLLDGRFIFIEWIDDEWFGYGGGQRSNKALIQEIDPRTLSIKMPERDFFMSLDIETGKGGDLLKYNEVLAWNGSMMNCTVIQFSSEGEREDYIIDLDNNDYDNIEVIGIQE